jgi:hypothetical protein
VVHGQCDDVVLGGQPQQRAAQQRTPREVERAAGLFAGEREGQRLARAVR